MARTRKQELEDDASFEDSVAKELTPEPETPEKEEEVSEQPKGEGEEKEEVVADTDAMTPEELSPDTVVKIGDTEYTAEEINALVEKGKLAKKVEDEQKIDISQLYPEFTKRSQLIKNPEALRQYVKEAYGMEVSQTAPSDEEKALKAQIEQARKLGFMTTDDKQDLIGEVMRQIEIRELGQAVDSAVAKYKVDRTQLIDFMSYLNTKDANGAAEKLQMYQKVAAVKPTATPATPAQKPEVLKTETKGTGVRVPPKEKPVPHPDKDPEGFAKLIESYLTPKTPEEIQ